MTANASLRGGTLFLPGETDDRGRELWKLPPDASSFELVRDFFGTPSSGPEAFTAFGNGFLFVGLVWRTWML